MSVIEGPIERDLDRLTSVRNQIRVWSIGSCVAIVVILTSGVGIVASSANRLVQPGPAQSEFTSDLGTDLNANVAPEVQSIVGQALSESQPQIQAQFIKLGTRVPDVSNAFLLQFTQLQKDLPERGDVIVDDTFGKTLSSLEPKIEAMYPNVNDATVDTMVGNVDNEAQAQFLADNDTLFGQHEAALASITRDIGTIRSTEPIGSDPDKANLDMAISVIEAFHNDLTSMDNGQSLTGSGAKKS